MSSIISIPVEVLRCIEYSQYIWVHHYTIPSEYGACLDPRNVGAGEADSTRQSVNEEPCHVCHVVKSSDTCDLQASNGVRMCQECQECQESCETEKKIEENRRNLQSRTGHCKAFHLWSLLPKEQCWKMLKGLGADVVKRRGKIHICKTIEVVHWLHRHVRENSRLCRKHQETSFACDESRFPLSCGRADANPLASISKRRPRIAALTALVGPEVKPISLPTPKIVSGRRPTLSASGHKEAQKKIGPSGLTVGFYASRNW